LSFKKILLAIEKYKRSEASIEKAPRIAGFSISRMLELFKEYGVEANLDYEDYLTFPLRPMECLNYSIPKNALARNAAI
jgi:hypothetical protein